MNWKAKFGPGQGHGLIGNREFASIHIAAKDLGLITSDSDDAYRDLLEAMFGVRTSKGLTFRKFYELMNRFYADGFRPFHKKAFVKAPSAGCEKQPMLKKIAAILGDMGLRWRYADGISRQMFGVAATAWCTPGQLHKIVATLEIHRRKAGLKTT